MTEVEERWSNEAKVLWHLNKNWSMKQNNASFLLLMETLVGAILLIDMKQKKCTFLVIDGDHSNPNIVDIFSGVHHQLHIFGSSSLPFHPNIIDFFEIIITSWLSPSMLLHTLGCCPRNDSEVHFWIRMCRRNGYTTTSHIGLARMMVIVRPRAISNCNRSYTPEEEEWQVHNIIILLFSNRIVLKGTEVFNNDRTSACTPASPVRRILPTERHQIGTLVRM